MDRPDEDDDAPCWFEEHAARSDERQARQEERDRYRSEME